MALAGDHVQVLVDGADLTADHNRIQVDASRQMLEATAFGMSGQRFIGGQRALKLSHSGYLNPQAAQSHPILEGVEVDGVVSVLVGNNADPVVGDPAFSMLVQQERYQSKPEVGQVIPFNADFANRGDEGGWGTILQAPLSVTNTTTGTSVDGEATSSNGGKACLHVLTPITTDSYTVVVEHSDSVGSGYTTLASFTLNGQSAGSEQVSLPTTVKRYVRLVATRSGSVGETLRYAATLLRL